MCFINFSDDAAATEALFRGATNRRRPRRPGVEKEIITTLIMFVSDCFTPGFVSR